MSIQMILKWYAYAGYPSWRPGAFHFVDALEEAGFSSGEARDDISVSKRIYAVRELNPSFAEIERAEITRNRIKRLRK